MIQISIPFRIGDIIVRNFRIWISANWNDVVAIHKIFVGILYLNHTLQAEQFITVQREKKQNMNRTMQKNKTKNNGILIAKEKERTIWMKTKWVMLFESYFSLHTHCIKSAASCTIYCTNEPFLAHTTKLAKQWKMH